MSEVKWIKIVTDIFDDEKIRLIESLPDAYAIIVIWFKILCLAGKSNHNGMLMMNDRIAYTDEMLATIFRMPVNTVRLAIDTFAQFEMIERYDNALMVSNWDKHQNVDGMERIREQNRVRQKAWYDRQKAISEKPNVRSNVSVTLPNATDKDIDKDIDIDINTRRFKPPTVDEVRAYCDERKNGIDAQAFIDHYAANGWMRGKNKIKDWKACVRTWESNRKNNTNSVKAETKKGIQRNEDLDAWLNKRVQGGIK